MQPKIYLILLFILVFIIGVCVGAIISNKILYPPAYPGSGDWNGDGAVNVLDLIAAIKQLFHGAEYPEIIYG